MIETKARAAQLVFTRVEPAYSSKAREGYQVVWASPSLTDEVVAEIEYRVRCFVPAPGREQRLQFSALRAGGYFVSRTEQIQANRSICDRDARPVFLAQAGWIEEGQLRKLGFNPFALLEAFPAGRKIEDLVEAFGRASGVASELEIEVSEAISAGAPSEVASEGAALVLTAEIVALEGPPAASRFFLHGESAQVEVVLRTLHAFLPPYLRRISSFDTQVDGCLLSGADYFFLAGNRPPPALSLQIVDLLAPQMAATTADVASIYLAWLARALALYPPAAVARQTETAYQVVLALCGRAADQVLGRLDREVCKEILGHEGDRLRSRLEAQLLPWLGRRLTDDYCKWVVCELVRTAPEELIADLAKKDSRPAHLADLTEG